MSTHVVFAPPHEFGAVGSGAKRYWRHRVDGGTPFEVGDVIELRELNPDGSGETGAKLRRGITWVERLPDGFMIASLSAAT